MFEDALMESSGKFRTRRGWFSGVAAICNCSALCLLVLMPLLHPPSLPKQTLSMVLAAPAPPASPSVHISHLVGIDARTRAFPNQFVAPRVIPASISSAEHEGPQSHTGLFAIGSELGGPFNGLPDSIGSATAPHVHLVPATKPTISSGVMQGRKLSGTDPRYPAIAIAAHVQGTVVLKATISKAGSIENLRFVSGPPMLEQAAEDAVRTWRFRPYLLNGEPVEIETTVNVIFHLGG
jgi:periplasmic protein TonB